MEISMGSTLGLFDQFASSGEIKWLRQTGPNNDTSKDTVSWLQKNPLSQVRIACEVNWQDNCLNLQIRIEKKLETMLNVSADESLGIFLSNQKQRPRVISQFS